MADAERMNLPVAYTRDTWVALDPWTQRDYLRANAITHRLSPGDGPVALLEWFYGMISENDGNGYAQHDAIDYAGKYIRITVPDPDLDSQAVPRF